MQLIHWLSWYHNTKKAFKNTFCDYSFKSPLISHSIWQNTSVVNKVCTIVLKPILNVSPLFPEKYVLYVPVQKINCVQRSDVAAGK